MEKIINTEDMKKTKNYKMFSLLEYNRDIVENHVKDLMVKIKFSNDLHLNPIIVTDDFRVVDGQHRLEAAKRLGEEIYYVVDENFDVSKLTMLNNTRRNWSLADHLKKFRELGNEDYLKLDELIKDINLNLTSTLIWVSHCDERLRINFKNGNFKLDLNEEKLQSILRCKKIISLMKKNYFKPINIYTQSHFHRALKKLIMNEFVDFDRFYERLQKSFQKLHFCSSSYEYAQCFSEIYNHGMHKDFLQIRKGKKEYDYLV